MEYDFIWHYFGLSSYSNTCFVCYDYALQVLIIIEIYLNLTISFNTLTVIINGNNDCSIRIAAQSL